MSAMPCPSQNELVRFEAGLLSDARHSELETHLEECEACRAQLVDLPAVQDAVTQSLRDQPGIEQFAKEPELANAVADLIAMKAGAEPGTDPDHSTLHDATPGWMLGDYRIIREIGRGGMGVVYKARQVSLSRIVALKVLSSVSLLNPTQLARFENEARAAASLHHEHIVPIYGVGSEGGMRFFAMQYVEGSDVGAILGEARRHADRMAGGSVAPDVRPDLQTRTRLERGSDQDESFRLEDHGDRQGTHSVEHPLLLQLSESAETGSRESMNRIARLITNAADALHYAHSQGIIHRDVKPSNLLVDRAGKIWLADFGLARIGPTGDLTASNAVMGTLRYMSPEQALGQGSVVDHRSDVYSLGATMYELLTLRPMYHAEDRAALLWSIAQADAASPATLNPRIPRDLESIVLKATAGEPGDRYQTAGDMAADLKRFLDGKPVLAKRPSPMDRLWKLSRRHRAVTYVTLTFVLMLAVVSSFSALVLSLQKEQLESTITELDDARTATLRAVDDARISENAARKTAIVALNRAYALTMRLAFDADKSGDPFQAEQLLAGVVPATGETDVRGLEWAFLHDKLFGAGSGRQLSEEPVYAIAPSPSGEFIAAAGAAGVIWLIDPKTLSIVAEIDSGQEEVNGLAFSGDGRLLASSGDDATIRLWEMPSRQMSLKIETGDDAAYSVFFAADGRKLVTSGRGSVVRVWDAQTGALSGEFTHHVQKVAMLAVSPDQRLVASADHRDAQVYVWDVESLEIVRLIHDVSNRVTAMTFSPDGRTLLTGQRRGEIRAWSLSGHSVSLVGRTIDQALSIAFSPDGREVVVTDRHGAARRWAVETPVAETPPAPPPAVLARQWRVREDSRRSWCGFSADGSTAVCCHGETIFFRDVATGQVVELPMREDTPLDPRRRPADRQMCSLSHDGRVFVCAGDVYQLRSDKEFVWEWSHRLAVPAERIGSLVLTPDSRTVISVDPDGQISLFSVGDGAALPGSPLQRPDRDLRSHESPIVVAVSPDGQLAAVSAVDGSTDIFELQSGRHIAAVPTGLKAGLRDLDISPDGRVLVSIDRESTEAQLWDTRTGEQLGTVPPHLDASPLPMSSVAFSPDGACLATTVEGYEDGSIRIRDLRHERDLWTQRLSSTVVRFQLDGLRLLAVDLESGMHAAWDFTNPEQTPAVTSESSPQSTDHEKRPLDIWQAHSGRCYAGVFGTSGTDCFTVGEDGVLKRWNLSRRRNEQVLTSNFEENDEIDMDVAVSPEEERIAVAGSQSLRIYQTTNDQAELVASVSDEALVSVTFIGDGREIATGHSTGELQLWRTSPLESVERRLIEPDNRIDGIAASPDGRLLAIELDGGDDRVRLLDAKSGRRASQLQSSRAEAVCFSPDGDLLAFGADDDVVLWDINGGMQEYRLKAHTNGVCAVSFDRTGRILASGSTDRTIVLWDLETRQPIRTLVGHQAEIRSMAFSGDGRSLLSCGEVESVRVWHVDTGLNIGEMLPVYWEKCCLIDGAQLLIGMPPAGRTVVRKLVPIP